jgi:hypothetical protein
LIRWRGRRSLSVLVAGLVSVGCVAVASGVGESTDTVVSQPIIGPDGRMGHGARTATDAVRAVAVDADGIASELRVMLDPGEEVIVGTDVTAPPPGYTITDGLPGAGDAVPQGAPWLVIAVRPGTGAQPAIASWYAAVLAGAVRDASASASAGTVTGYSLVVRDRGHDRVAFSGRLDGVTVGQVFDKPDASVVAARAASFGLRVVEVATASAGGQGVTIVRGSAPPAALRAFLAEGAGSIDRSIFGDPISIEASLIVISDDVTGAPAIVVGNAGRTVSGFAWVAESLACEPGAQGGFGMTDTSFMACQTGP